MCSGHIEERGIEKGFEKLVAKRLMCLSDS